jgi:hypothetical protein
MLVGIASSSSDKNIPASTSKIANEMSTSFISFGNGLRVFLIIGLEMPRGNCC